MPAHLLDGDTITLQADNAVEVRPKRAGRPAFSLVSAVAKQRPLTPAERIKKRSADRQIITVRKDGEEFRAAAVDLGFELYTRGDPTPEVITDIVKHYLVVALEAKRQQPGQRILIVILRAKPETFAKVEANNPADPYAPALYVLVSSEGESKNQRVPLEVILRSEEQTKQTKKPQRGQVRSEEIRQLLQ
ncbi:MAG: hypothetical protein INR62_14195, partial [Rhodospirillales bacterium]|nr:hypothetical protein [Acetobacter sp.]